MTPDEKLKAFKEVTRSYPKYLEHIQGIDDKLEVLQSKMQNVHSIDFEKEPGTPRREERPLVEMIERKTLLEKEKAHYQELIDWVHSVIDSFESPSIKALIWMTYIQRKSLASLADEFLISKDNLYKIRRKHLNRVLSDELMERLDEIQNDFIAENSTM